MYQCGCCRAAASLVCVHPQLPEDVCRLLGIPPLQEVVSETVDVKQPLEYVDTLDVSLCSQDRAHLNAPHANVCSDCCRSSYSHAIFLT